jgi:hypothetical protein
MAIKVFLSWSGARSKAVADALEPWLRQVIQALDPWISTNIQKGTRWGPEVSRQLEDTKIGIICLTRDNLTEPWLLFESGALSKTKDAYVCTFLLDIPHTEIEQPLAQFQHTTAEQEVVRALAHTLNDVVSANGDRALGEADLEEVFDLFWPNLQKKLSAIPAAGKVKEKPREDSDILREILEAVRAGQRPLEAKASPRYVEIDLSKTDPKAYSIVFPTSEAPSVRGVVGVLRGLIHATENNHEDGRTTIKAVFDRPSWNLLKNSVGNRFPFAKIKKTVLPSGHLTVTKS